MIINGVNYLLLEKRGCDFFKGDPVSTRSDVGNYRVFTRFRDKEGCLVRGDLFRGNVYDHNKKSRPLVYDCALACDLQIGHYLYRAGAENNYDYTLSDILRFVNSVSCDMYEKTKFVYEFDFTQPKGANFVPSNEMFKFAARNKLECFTNHYGETIVKLYAGDYKYLCYSVEPISDDLERVTITLEEIIE